MLEAQAWRGGSHSWPQTQIYRSKVLEHQTFPSVLLKVIQFIVSLHIARKA